jgi:hypothetical protein
MVGMRGLLMGRGINPIRAALRNADATAACRQHLTRVNSCFTFGGPRITL